MNKEWINAAGIRAVKTMAEVALGFIVTGAAVSEINWVHMASVAVVAGVGSILWSIKGLPELGSTEEDE